MSEFVPVTEEVERLPDGRERLIRPEPPEIVERVVALANRLRAERGANAFRHFYLNPADWDEAFAHYTGRALPKWEPRPVFTLETEWGALHLHASRSQPEGCFVAAEA